MHLPKTNNISDRILHSKQLLHISDNLSHLSHKKEVQVLSRIAKICFNFKLPMILGVLGVLGTVFSQLLLPYLIGNGINKAAAIISSTDGSNMINSLLIIGLFIILASIARGLFGFLIMYFGEKTGNQISSALRNSFHKKLQSLSFSFHDKVHSGNLMSRGILDIEGVAMFVRTGVFRTLEIFILMVCGGILLLSIDWKIGLISLIFIFPVASIATTTRLRLRKIWTTIQQFYSQLNTNLQENLTGVRVVRAFGGQAHEINKFENSHRKITSRTKHSIKVAALGQSLNGFFFLLTWALVIWVGGLQVISGSLSIGELTQCLIYLGMLQRPVRMMGMLVNAYARAISCGLRLFEILEKEPIIRSIKTPATLDKISKIEANNVYFKFDDDSEKFTLENISFKIKSGEILGIMGPPGSGKSAIAQLLPRFYDIDSGVITIDDIDVKNIYLTNLRREMGIISQHTFLFNTTIKENISYGMPESEMSKIIEVAKTAEIHDFIDSLPDKYETMVGEFGVSLSGGENQRISIARTLLTDPSMLIFDDSLSALDSITDRKIRNHLESLNQSKLILIISHRVDSLDHADEIIVLNQGKISQRGTPSQLLKEEGIYRTISDIQHPMYEKSELIESPYQT